MLLLLLLKTRHAPLAICLVAMLDLMVKLIGAKEKINEINKNIEIEYLNSASNIKAYLEALFGEYSSQMGIIDSTYPLHNHN